jgi:chromatin segregation and condensation protein Rec8/ScpA/Scc1 (kleisin family)
MLLQLNGWVARANETSRRTLHSQAKNAKHNKFIDDPNESINRKKYQYMKQRENKTWKHDTVETELKIYKAQIKAHGVQTRMFESFFFVYNFDLSFDTRTRKVVHFKFWLILVENLHFSGSVSYQTIFFRTQI